LPSEIRSQLLNACKNVWCQDLNELTALRAKFLGVAVDGERNVTLPRSQVAGRMLKGEGENKMVERCTDVRPEVADHKRQVGRRARADVHREAVDHLLSTLKRRLTVVLTDQSAWFRFEKPFDGLRNDFQVRVSTTHISTSYVARANLQLRMNNRRFTRLTNAYSKKAENHARSVAIHFMARNYVRAHGTLTKAAKDYKATPAIVCGLTDHVWTVEEMLSKMEIDYAIAA
jgi:IS1 family transposase